MENNRPLGWTTIKEAKKLVKAGLDPNTADMWISPNGKFIGDSKQKPTYNTYFCWSLGALKNIVEEEFGKDFSYENGEWVIIVWSDLSGYKHYYFEEIVNCVLWLLENGYIEKHE